VSVVPRHDGRVDYIRDRRVRCPQNNIHDGRVCSQSVDYSRTKIRRHHGTHGTDFFVVGGAKVELAQALVPCETGAM